FARGTKVEIEEVYATTNELVFIHFNFHFCASRETDSVLGDHARKMPGTLQVRYPLNLFLRIGRIRKVIKAEEVLQCIFALVYKRQVIQRQVGYQPPVCIFSYWRANRI